jgi:mono/diheme cytochrome c family protein
LFKKSPIDPVTIEPVKASVAAAIRTIVAAFVLCCVLVAPVAAAGQRSRDFTLELANMAMNARLLGQPGLAATAAARLRDKLDGAIGVLGLLARARAEELRQPDAAVLAVIGRLQAAYRKGGVAAARPLILGLARRYPMDLIGILPLGAGPGRVAAGRALYRRLCMGCHAYTDPRSPVPAPDLFAMGRSMAAPKFVARLIGGVRGTPDTSLIDPLSDFQIAELAAYLRAGTAGKRAP